jgi:hypothetical protein
VAEENFLSRWSRRKIHARAAEREEAPAAPVAGSPAPAPAAAEAQGAPVESAPLPPVESLTPESDFAPFMSPEVDGDTRRKALKTLFTDPHFNTMDMMDVYVDDYSKPDPLPDSWLEKLEQVSRLGDRAGRDREEAERLKEAERRKELAEAAQAGEPAQPGPEATAAPERAPDVKQDAPPELADDIPPPAGPIPPLPLGGSGT